MVACSVCDAPYVAVWIGSDGLCSACHCDYLDGRAYLKDESWREMEEEQDEKEDRLPF